MRKAAVIVIKSLGFGLHEVLSQYSISLSSDVHVLALQVLLAKSSEVVKCGLQTMSMCQYCLTILNVVIFLISTFKLS